MKSLRLIALLLACSLAQAGSLGFKASFGEFQALNYDAFAYANGALPSPWATMTGETLEFTVTSNTVSTGAAGSDNAVRFTTLQPAANQYAWIVLSGTIQAAGVGDGYCAAVRMSSSADTFYRGCCNGAGSAISSKIAGTGNTIASQSSVFCATGDGVVLSVVGTTLTLWDVHNGTWTQLNQGTDSNIASGYCGMGYSSTNTGAVSLFQCGSAN